MSEDRISVDDPEKDYRTITDNTMRVLCDRQRNRENLVPVNIDEIWQERLRAYHDRQLLIRNLQRFQNESNFIQLSDRSIILTESGRQHCIDNRL
jgi:Ran GTPase-activating protein (RanGAP) involved in mRNA processing and transport